MARVLVPVAILEGESVSAGLTSLLGTVDVTVLGYHVLPEQTPPDQARQQYEDRANAALEDVAAEFRAAGGDADYRLVFTHDREKTIGRVAEEVDARAYVVPGTTGAVEQLLVSPSGDVAVERIVSFVADLVGDRDVGVTLFRAAGEASDEARAVLENAAAALAERGIEVRTELAIAGTPIDALLDATVEHDAIVVGERAPSLRSLLFGEEAERIAAETVGPVLVVRRDEELDRAE